MFFRRSNNTKSDWAIGLDFGMSRVRGVFIRRKNAVTTLENFDVRPLPAAFGKADCIPAAAAEIAQMFGGWDVPARRAYASINPPSAVVCQAELPPRMPLHEARAALQLNSVNSIRHQPARAS